MTAPPRVLATICARGGSKGVPSKNLRVLAGRSLLAHAIACARRCPEVGRIVVSTDDERIAQAARAEGVEVPWLRPASMSTDTAPKVEAIRHATERAEAATGERFDLVVDLDVGVPTRAPEDVSGCIGVLLRDPALDAAVTVYPPERNPYFNMVELEGGRARLVKQPPRPVTRRQDAPVVYSVTPSVFAWRRGRLHVAHLYEGAWGVHPVPRERAVDIDTEEDLRYVEHLLRTREAPTRAR